MRFATAKEKVSTDSQVMDVSISYCCRWLSGNNQFLCQYGLRPSVGPMLNL